MRLDLFIKEKYNISRQKAQELIKCQAVSVNGRLALKSSLDINDADEVVLGKTDSVLKYVGRGGYKLEGAVEYFGIDLKNKYCIDIGASTGGFTDCMLQNGAQRVLSVDVGSSQLSQRLLNDKRVISLENTDIRLLDFAKYGNADFVGCDVSFISLSLIADAIYNCLSESGDGVLLIKPQFEAGRDKLSKSGIVKDFKVHKQVIKRVVDNLSSYGLYAMDICTSPIRGGDGNIEYLLHISKNNSNISDLVIANTVDMAQNNKNFGGNGFEKGWCNNK